MKLDLSGAELFLAYLAGDVRAHEVLQHPAYQAVELHARLYSDGLSEQDLDDALQGRDSAFYGLEHLAERMPGIMGLLRTIRKEQQAWIEAAGSSLSKLLPDAGLDITVYPILGYDMGIGLDEVVCMNCNVASYIADPREFLFFIIHECMHVIYERSHHIPALKQVQTTQDWRSFFNLWVQNEGYAVYGPLKLREQMACLAERDYSVLGNPVELERLRLLFLGTLDTLAGGDELRRDQYLEACFGPERLTYRIGCELIRRIERQCGLEGVREAFHLDADTFIGRYLKLLK